MLVKDAGDQRVELQMTTINGKPVILRTNARTVLNLDNLKFTAKRLCDGITLNPGDACMFGCSFCYIHLQVIKFVNGAPVEKESCLSMTS